MAWSGPLGGLTLLSWLGLVPGDAGHYYHGLVWSLECLDIAWSGPWGCLDIAIMAWFGPWGGWTLQSWLSLVPAVSGHYIHGLVWTLGWLDIASMA